MHTSNHSSLSIVILLLPLSESLITLFFSLNTSFYEQCNRVTPLEFTSRILFDDWKLGETEEEITVFRVTVKGEYAGGQTEEVVYDMCDEYNSDTGTSSMSRTTGHTATAAANLFLDGLFAEKGVFPPELVGKHKACFDYFLKIPGGQGDPLYQAYLHS